jgi:AcrR family transcriptional regulator
MSIAQRSVERALASRYATYTEEVNRLIASCLKIMEQTGNFDPRVGDILADAGLSNQAFYRHFQSKEELLLAVLDKGARELTAYLTKRMAAQPDPMGKIRAWIRGFAAQAIRPKAAAATRPFMFPSARLHERFPQEVPMTERQFLDLLEPELKEGIAVGQIRSDVDPAGDAVFIYDLVKNWMERQLRESPMPSEAELVRRADKLERFLVKAIGA